MPQERPAVGETWSPPTGAGSALVVQANSEAVRLLFRNGVSQMMPIRSLLLNQWSMTDAAPEMHLCHECDSPGAVIKHRLPGHEVWVCPTHAPMGINLYFPADQATNHRPRVARCLHCESPDISIQSELGGELYAATVCKCESCGGEQITLCRGSLTDDAFTQVVESALTASLYDYQQDEHGGEIVPPLSAGRDCFSSLRRGTGQSGLVGERSVLQRDDLPPDVLVITSRTAALYVPEAPVTRRSYYQAPERQSTYLPPIDEVGLPRLGSTWRRRRSDNQVMLCEITTVDRRTIWSGATSLRRDYIHYRISYNPTNITFATNGQGQPLPMIHDQFLDHWLPIENGQQAQQAMLTAPEVGSFWKDLTGSLVRILPASAAQRISDRVSYTSVVLERAQEDELFRFMRMHRLMPSPETSRVWFDGKEVKHVVGVTRDLFPQVVFTRDGFDERKQVDQLEFYRKHDPFTLSDSAVSYTPDNPVRSDNMWVGKEGDRIIQDVGTCVTAKEEYVRLKATGTLPSVMLPLSAFLNEYEPKVLTAPCSFGELWLEQGEGGQVWVVDYVTPSHRIFLRLREASSITMEKTFTELASDFRKVTLTSAFDLDE